MEISEKRNEPKAEITKLGRYMNKTTENNILTTTTSK
jgi:hypothetical protein